MVSALPSNTVVSGCRRETLPTFQVGVGVDSKDVARCGFLLVPDIISTNITQPTALPSFDIRLAFGWW